MPRAVPAHSLCMCMWQAPIVARRAPHIYEARRRPCPTRGAIVPPRRLKVTYEAPTRTRAKVQQSIDARSACLEVSTATAHTLTTRSHAAPVATPPPSL